MGIDGRSLLRLALILVIAAGTAAAFAYALWSQLSDELSVSTDIVGYPAYANFNIERYYQRYWLAVGFVPLVTLGLFLVLDRIVPGRPPSRRKGREPAREERIQSSPNRSWAIAARVALVGAILAVEIAMVIQREPAWIWTIGVPATIFYSVVIAALGRWVDTLPGANAWERAASANALATPITILGLLAASRGTKVVAPNREWDFAWLPVWVAVAGGLAAFAWIAAQLFRGVAPTSVDRRVALVIAGPLALFLSISMLPGDFGAMDMFHEGERLAGVELLRDGAFPWRDLVFIHGILYDVLSPLLGVAVFENSRWGAFSGENVFVVPLYWMAIYAFCAYVFRTNWLYLLASQVVVFATIVGAGQSKFFDFLFGTHIRFVALPLALVALIALLRRATALRAGFFSGIVVIQTILSPEAAIAGVVFSLAVPAYEAMYFRRDVPIAENFRRTWLAITFGLGQFAVWCAFLAWHGALDDFISVYLTFASNHELTGGIPLHPSIAHLSRAIYVPPIAALAMLGLVAVLLLRRQRVSPEDWGVAAMALFILAYYHKFLARADAHVLQVSQASLPLVLYVVFRFVSALDRLVARVQISTGPLKGVRISRGVTTALFVLVVTASASAVWRGLESLPTRLEGRASGQPRLRAVGFATRAAVDESIVRDMRAISDYYLEPGDTVFDFSNTPALFHYLLDLEPATRYYHVSLAVRRKTQLDLIEELEQRRPKLVFVAGSLGLPSWDGVSNQVRHYEISEWLLDRYRPVVAAHGYVAMIPKAAHSPPLSPLVARLGEKPVTERLYFQSPPCNWAYAPNFLNTEPETPGRALTIDPANDRFFVRGWAADLAARKPARLVLVALGERIVAWEKPRIMRPDIEKALGGKTFRRSGFLIDIPWTRLGGQASQPIDPSRLRIYGLLDDGRALELAQGPSASWQPSSPPPAELSLGGRRFQVAKGASQGIVDESANVLSVRTPSFAPFAWLEIESRRPLPENVFVVSTTEHPSDPFIFGTVDRGERRVRVRLGACTQWYGSHGNQLRIRSRVYPDIKAVRLYR